jgi:hypothetical protein
MGGVVAGIVTALFHPNDPVISAGEYSVMAFGADVPITADVHHFAPPPS